MKQVSVIIPTYNRQSEVLRAVESVIKQTIKPFEIIVIDDGSTDNTENVLSSVQEHIRYIKTENNGVSSARNRGKLRGWEKRGQWAE
jgi:glycosyltransferase involved in cell wall biosynthesis